MSSKIKILHLTNNDGKFVGNAIELFNSIPNLDNEVWEVKRKTNHIDHYTNQPTQVVSYNEFRELCCSQKYADAIVLHSFWSLSISLVREIHPETKVILFTWGKDVYDNTYPQYPLIPLKNEVRSKIGYHIIHSYLNKKIFKGIAASILGVSTRKHFKDALKRIDYFSGVFPIEWDYIRKFNPIFKAKKISFNYANKLSPISEKNLNEPVDTDRINIQVGHSGFIKLNHLRIFNLIKDILPENCKVIAPLSYSPSGEKYSKSIMREGEKLFKESFHPLVDFIEYSEYVKIMNSINVAIFDVDRQCAVGNILIALWNGAKIFLPKNSINYQYFNSIGIKIFSIEDDLSKKEFSSQLSWEEVINNRKQLVKYWSYENVQTNFINSLREVFPTI